jgi:hypothetical protein
MGWICLLGQPLVIALNEIVNLTIMLICNHVNNPSSTTPILPSSLLATYVGFKRTPSLSLRLQPLGQLSHNLVRLISNVNDISSQDRHLFESIGSNIAPTHDNNPSVVVSLPTIVTYYGKE